MRNRTIVDEADKAFKYVCENWPGWEYLHEVGVPSNITFRPMGFQVFFSYSTTTREQDIEVRDWIVPIYEELMLRKI
jgi:hypothetical protein